MLSNLRLQERASARDRGSRTAPKVSKNQSCTIKNAPDASAAPGATEFIAVPPGFVASATSWTSWSVVRVVDQTAMPTGAAARGPFGWRLRGDIQRIPARGSHHPPVAQAGLARLFVPIDVLPRKLASAAPKHKLTAALPGKIGGISLG